MDSTKKSVILLLLFGVITYVSTQDLDSCERRRIHSSFTDSRGVNHNYFFSWLDSRTQAGFTWSEARGICRRHCMDLVSPETPWENSWLKQQGIPGQGIWTSGTKQGSLVNGWVWSAVGERIKPTDNTLNGDWSSGQPDNNDGQGGDEGCLAVMNSFDGIKWNDQACNLRKAFVCEDSDSLLSFVGLRNSGGGNFGNSNNNGDFRPVGNSNNNGDFRPVGNSNNNGDFRPVGNNNNWNSRPIGNNNNNWNSRPNGRSNNNWNNRPNGNNNNNWNNRPNGNNNINWNSRPNGNNNNWNSRPNGNSNNNFNSNPNGNNNNLNSRPVENNNNGDFVNTNGNRRDFNFRQTAF